MTYEDLINNFYFNPDCPKSILGGCLFPAYKGIMPDIINKNYTMHVWTLISEDRKTSYIVQGKKYCDAIGYFISKDPAEYEDSTKLEIQLDYEKDNIRKFIFSGNH